MPLQATSGAASYDAFGGGAAAAPPTYIEEVFSTYLYTGTGASRTIVNNIDLATYGGLIWIKDRIAVTNHCLVDTVQGITKNLVSNTTAAAATVASGDDITSFTTTGWTFGNNNLNINNNGDNFASWTFRKQPKFFDIVTWTGNDVAGRTISHSLGSAPATIIVKRTNATSNWAVYHRSLGATKAIFLNKTDAAVTSAAYWNNTEPTSTVFSIGDAGAVNEGGATAGTYVAYLFAHDAGGFGLTGTDNVISCGSFTTNGSGAATVSLGYEPQWVLWKAYGGTTGVSDWDLFDNMRGYCVPGATNDARLQPNNSDAEGTFNIGGPNATGFTVANQNATSDYIYIAIRRGPMAVPTDSTKVFKPVTRAGTSATATVSGVGFAPDMCLTGTRDNGAYDTSFDRLRGLTRALFTPVNNVEDGSFTNSITSFTMDGMTLGADTAGSFSDVVNGSGANYVYWLMKRAPSFFDEVCYTGNNTSGRTITHNLAAVPELMIVKSRSNAINWAVYYGVATNALRLNATTAATSETYWNDTSPTASVFSVGSTSDVNQVNYTYVAYLFATCPGVSKVGSYTGNGSTQTIDCGFGAGGARFVLIKRTDATGGWYVYDTARGMTVLTDPYLFLNSTAAEVATLGSVTTVSTGFAVNAAIVAAINTNAASYIFLAIA